MRGAVPLLCITLLLAACSNPDASTDADERPAPRVAEVDLEIGVVEGEAPNMFGRISGLAVDDRSRLYVADGQHHEIRVFDDEGAFPFAIGEPGKGPGELQMPCCVAFDAEGRLWVQRSVADGAPNEADVYDHDGALVEVVQWPAGISLHLGTFRDSVAYGIRSGGADDVDRVVRLRL